MIADIASGTGIFTRMLLENGNRVFGVEPNAEMRQAGEEFLRSYSSFTSVAGTAEATTLEDHSVDFVTAAQAAHWFDRERARREFIRICKPGGWTVLLWNERRTGSRPSSAPTSSCCWSTAPTIRMCAPSARPSRSKRSFAPSRFQVRSFDYRQEFDYPALEGRLLSSSYTPQADDAGYTPMLHELRRVFDAHQANGRVTFEYDTRVYYGQLG